VLGAVLVHDHVLGDEAVGVGAQHGLAVAGDQAERARGGGRLVWTSGVCGCGNRERSEDGRAEQAGVQLHGLKPLEIGRMNQRMLGIHFSIAPSGGSDVEGPRCHSSRDARDGGDGACESRSGAKAVSCCYAAVNVSGVTKSLFV
jgi:hypothetical protein